MKHNNVRHSLWQIGIMVDMHSCMHACAHTHTHTHTHTHIYTHTSCTHTLTLKNSVAHNHWGKENTELARLLEV